MEKREDLNLKDPSLKLAREVGVLKEALEVSRIKEQVIAKIMQVEDKDVLVKIAEAVRKYTTLLRPIDNEGPPVEQGNG
jgi:hypothetical protein